MDPYLSETVRTQKLDAAIFLGLPVRWWRSPYEGVRLINVRWAVPDDGQTPLIDQDFNQIQEDIAKELIKTGVRLDQPCIAPGHGSLLHWILNQMDPYLSTHISDQAGISAEDFTMLLKGSDIDPEWSNLAYTFIRDALAEAFGVTDLQPYQKGDTIIPIMIDCRNL